MVYRVKTTVNYLTVTRSCQKETSSHSEVFLNFIGTEIEHGLSINPSKKTKTKTKKTTNTVFKNPKKYTKT